MNRWARTLLGIAAIVVNVHEATDGWLRSTTAAAANTDTVSVLDLPGCPRAVIPSSCQDDPTTERCFQDVADLHAQGNEAALMSVVPPSCRHRITSPRCAQDVTRMRAYAKIHYPACGLEQLLPSALQAFPPLASSEVDTPEPPPGVAHPFAYTRWSSPPPGFSAATVWGQTIQDTRRAGSSWIEVDWMRLHEIVDGNDRVILSDEYQDGKAYGHLASRDPWFANNTKDPWIPEFDRPNGLLIVRPNDRPNRVYHWWSHERAAVSASSAARYWAEARIRVHGPAAVQIGIDYYTNLTGPSVPGAIEEGGVSDWVFDEQSDWQTVTVSRL